MQDEFCTYMLLEYQEKDLMEGEKVPLFPYPLKVPAISYLRIYTPGSSASHCSHVTITAGSSQLSP